MAQNGKNENGKQVGQKSVKTHWNREPQEDTSIKCSNINHLKLKSQKDNLTKRQKASACLASKSCTELGPAQPQLVLIVIKSFVFDFIALFIHSVLSRQTLMDETFNERQHLMEDNHK